MRLIALRFQGIGPYRGEFAIDFTALTRGHMFLIEGETGAGKTTILDAIVYALYGGVSGSDGKQRMRSRFLYDSDTPSWVDLIFMANGECYRIRRSPDYTRPKQRGDGTTSIAAKAKLWHVDKNIGSLIDLGGDAGRFFDYADEPGHAQALAGRMKEASVEIVSLLGLNRDQFSKTIMLAQGEFSRFLEMKPEDRTDLLKDLFGAQIYEDIQRDLHERAAKAKATMDDGHLMLANAIAMARDNASGIDSIVDDDGAWCVDADGELVEPAWDADQIERRLRDTLAQVKASSAGMQREAQTRKETADAALASARGRRALVDAIITAADGERDQARLLRSLADQGDRIAMIETRLERAAKAAAATARHEELRKAKEREEQAKEALSAAKDELEAAGDADDLAARHAVAVAASRDEAAANERKETVKAKRERLETLSRVERECVEAQKAHAQAMDARTKAAEELAALGDAVAMEERRQQVARALGERQHRQEVVARAESTLGEVRERDALERRLAKAKARLAVCREASASAVRAVEQSRALLDQSGAARYAARLRDGEPCPVCGATEHPAPATVPDDVPGLDMLEAYERRAERCGQDESEAAEAVSTLRAQCEAMEARLGGIDEDGARAAIDEARHALGELDALEQEDGTLRRRLDAITQASQKASEAATALAEAQTRAAMARQMADEARAAAEGITEDGVADEERAIRERIDVAREQAALAAELERRIARCGELRRQVAAGEATLASRHSQVETLEQTERELCGTNGFVDVEQALACVLPQDEMDGLRVQVETHRADMIRVRAALERSRTSLASVLGCSGAWEALRGSLPTAPDGGAMPLAPLSRDLPDAAGPLAYDDDGKATALGELIESIDSGIAADAEAVAKDDADDAAVSLGRVRRFEEERQRCARMVRERLSAWRATVERFGPLEAMSELVAGHVASASGQKVTLITYAVTERFRDVLDQTNDILRDIHGGVYELRLGEREGRANARTGLPIEVVDHRTERMRDPSTLSGGEKFFVSLALALGLARTIQAENGGIPMDTLFIDEGFGTLSEDYREDVMDVLRDIARQRDVGIISHVEDLKSQIPERIRVSRMSMEGESTLEVIA